ncbi:MAG: hypothetical protein KDH16_22065 [Rhodocyclaceae bacterium]|nr:hypothetical protein [Rhodocyclaceae bacterium]
MAPMYVTIAKASELLGYTVSSIDKKIERKVWVEGEVWVKAPDAGGKAEKAFNK